MKLEDKVLLIRAAAIKKGREPVSLKLQGIDRDKINSILEKIDKNTPDMVSCVFALLDNVNETWFSAKKCSSLKINNGASVAHIACHIGILQRGKTKLDREGRDYWIKPLRDIGAVEPVIFIPEDCEFSIGHPKAKSPHSAYRLSNSFEKLLLTDVKLLDDALKKWISDDSIRIRLEHQAAAAKITSQKVDSSHKNLIDVSISHYAKQFLPEYNVIYVDDSDGDRVTEAEEKILKDNGIEITLHDAMPDVLLINDKKDSLWVIEAVTSDGEVDYYKIEQLKKFANRNNIKNIYFTTTYLSWSAAAKRQGKHKNIAPDTYIWIAEDGAKHFKVETFNK